MEHEFLTADEVADVLRVTRVTVWRMLRSGRLPGVKPTGCGWRVRRTDLAAYLDANRVAPAEESS